MELAFLVRDILRQRHVERLAQHREQDNEAEAEWEIARWRHRSGVVIQRRYELEIAQQDSASCRSAGLTGRLSTPPARRSTRCANSFITFASNPSGWLCRRVVKMRPQTELLR
ncbi:hypothetical protein RKF94_03650 [Klebsiella pneumoniae]|nr:hypothetical protein [Klebsiella pneumoniae]